MGIFDCIGCQGWLLGVAARTLSSSRPITLVSMIEPNAPTEIPSDLMQSESAKQQQQLTERIAHASSPFREIVLQINHVLVGQSHLVDRMLIGLLTGGHLLIEGVPGLAKTTAVASLAKAINTGFQRLQFTPDLLPADLIGTQVYRPQDQTFVVQKGPIFSNLVLADEINRAPAKVQSALLEAMQEHQVTIGSETFPLPEPFLVMATQNPVEQEGTYALPEAQTDRFMLKVIVDYPNREEELQILRRMGKTGTKLEVSAVASPEDILAARELIDEIHLDEKVEGYIVDLVMATRRPEAYGLQMDGLIQFGGSPRATINLTLAARAAAFLAGRAYVLPADVRSIALDVLRHRVMITYEAEAEDLTSESIVQQILDHIPAP
ncbi:MoxR-like ATPase in aerotolerance operon [Rhodopirellula islandica]|uniref:MoxR-like ATPase in aerotolerance operon n=2 Tax=Rhodopirellula islandica TaxID=595434 RepID=A0A0J1B9H7_RHOIS|nr:MoxR-like ATPase in aerotolerance operon [Rhodopirellula islandica]